MCAHLSLVVNSTYSSDEKQRKQQSVPFGSHYGNLLPRAQHVSPWQGCFLGSRGHNLGSLSHVTAQQAKCFHSRSQDARSCVKALGLLVGDIKQNPRV